MIINIDQANIGAVSVATLGKTERHGAALMDFSEHVRATFNRPKLNDRVPTDEVSKEVHTQFGVWPSVSRDDDDGPVIVGYLSDLRFTHYV